MKRILLASTAVLALTAVQSAFAADAPIYKGPPPVAAAYDPWYVSLFGGWSASGREYDFSFVNAAGTRFPYGVSLDNGWIIGGALGKQFARNWRFEVEVAHARFNFGNDYHSIPPAFFGANETGALGLTSVLGNVWFGGDLGWGWASPYIGGGLGVVFANGSLTVTNGAGAQIRGSDTEFAAMAGAGLRFPIGPNWELDVGYRLRYYNHITLPSAIVGFTTCCGSNIITHSIQGGVTVKF